MSSRYAAARPNRAAETFARQHHGRRAAGDGGDSDEDTRGPDEKIAFDVRNPSALAPDTREEDDVLDADVIGVGTGATKRGAVNIDGYDSDSDNETFNARAAQRKRPAKKSGAPTTGYGATDENEGISLIDQLDNYDKRLRGDEDGETKGDDEDGDDMFGGDDDDEVDNEKKKKSGDGIDVSGKKTWKELRFMRHIEGQEETSKSGGHVRLDEESSSDEEDVALAIQEEDVDEEVGAGGLKKHAPKIDAFNMRQEQEEGAFDESGNFIRKAADADALHDRWLDGLSKKEMKRAAAAHERREADLKQIRREDDSFITSDLFAALITRLELGETPLEALARLGKDASHSKKAKAKKIPQWRLKQMEKKKQAQNGAGEQRSSSGEDADQMDVDKSVTQSTADPAQAKVKTEINAITEAADRLLNRDYPDIYDTSRERLIRNYRAETGEAWVDPRRPAEEELSEDGDPHSGGGSNMTVMWEYRWMDGRDGGTVQGPFDGPAMKAWKDAGYFEDVEFRPAGSEESWQRDVSFV